MELKTLYQAKKYATYLVNERATGIEAGKKGTYTREHLFKLPNEIRKSMKEHIKNNEDLEQARLICEQTNIICVLCDFGKVISHELVNEIYSTKTSMDLERLRCKYIHRLE